MMMASSVSGASSTSFMRRKSSRQLSPQSTKIRVCPPETTALLPFDPDASTVNRTMLRGYSERLCNSGRFERARQQPRQTKLNLPPRLGVPEPALFFCFAELRQPNVRRLILTKKRRFWDQNGRFWAKKGAKNAVCSY
jgi:hypothetical protein